MQSMDHHVYSLPCGWTTLCSFSFVLFGFICTIAWEVLLQSWPGKDVQSIQYVQWITDEENPHYMTEWLTQQATPMVLKETPFNKWSSVNWTLESFEQNTHIKQILSKKGTSNIFKYFAVNQPLSDIEFMNVEKDYIEVIYPSNKFFQILQQPFDGHYYYSSGGIELLNLKENVYSKNSLERVTFPSHRDQFGQVNYWFGSENVTAYTHYDTSYNLHMIVRGRKKFIIFPPDVYHNLGLYPCLHQLYRQVYTKIFKDKDTIQRLGGVEVILNPGEVMYLPPYWFHSVVTMETTISLNVWSHSEVFLIMEEIFAEGIPFEEHWGREKLMKALNFYVKHLIERVLGTKGQSATPGVFVREKVYSRYKPLIEGVTDKDIEQVRSTVSGYCLDIPIEELVNSAELEHITSGVEKLAAHFVKIFSQPILELNLGNYIEHLTYRILGQEDIVMLPFYLHRCF